VAVEIFHLDQRSYWLPDVSHVFHGRDIFAPAAAHLAAGVPLTKLGSRMSDPVLLDLPRPRRTPEGLVGEIIHIDHFGNAASNIMLEDLEGQQSASDVRVGSTSISGVVKTFGERPPGDVVALFGSTGNLIVSVVNGSAAAKLDIRVGDPIQLALQATDRGSDRRAA